MAEEGLRAHAEVERLQAELAEARSAGESTVRRLLAASERLGREREQLLEEWGRLASDLADARRRLASALAAGERREQPRPETQSDEEHVLLVPGANGYLLLHRTGVLPAVGETVELRPADDGEACRFVVVKVGPSALPDDRSCVYLDHL